MRQCLKCGKKTEDRAVFCGDCLGVMEKYPVKPGTIVHILHRQPRAAANEIDTFDQRTQIELLSRQRRMIRRLTVAIAALSVLLGISAILLLHDLDKEQPNPVIGRNYTASTSNISGKTP